jgi:hypothetical protein
MPLNRKTYQHQLELHLSGQAREILRIRAKAGRTGVDPLVRFDRVAESLKRIHGEVALHLRDIRAASEESWAGLRAGALVEGASDAGDEGKNRSPRPATDPDQDDPASAGDLRGDPSGNRPTPSKPPIHMEVVQTFAMVVTAEPYFAVTQPGDEVVMENVAQPEAARASFGPGRRPLPPATSRRGTRTWKTS